MDNAFTGDKEASLLCLIALIQGCNVRVSAINAFVGKLMKRTEDLRLRGRQASTILGRETVADHDEQAVYLAERRLLTK